MFNFKLWLLAKIRAQILLSLVKKLPHMNQERHLHRSSIIYKKKRVHNSSKQICGGSWCETTTGWTFHYRKHYYGLWTLDILWIMDKHVAFGLNSSCYLLWVDSHSDGTHSLQRIQVIKYYIFKSVSMNKQTHLHLWWKWRWILFSAHVHFWVKYSFKTRAMFIIVLVFLLFFKNLVTFSSPVKLKLHVE